MKTIETVVYNFNELDEKAKEKARAWYREGAFDYEWYDSIYEDATTIAALMGISIDKIYFSGFYSQGDGACFEGSYTHKEGSLQAVIDYAPQDDKLHAIAAGLAKLQHDWKNTLNATIKHRGHYYHSGCTEIDVYNRENPYGNLDCEQDIKDALRSFMDWIYSQLEKEYEYQNSDEQVDVSILANEYTFTETGKRF